MKTPNRILIALLFFFAQLAWGQYGYWYDSTLTSIDPTIWQTVNGSLTATEGGLTCAASGSMMVRTVSGTGY